MSTDGITHLSDLKVHFDLERLTKKMRIDPGSSLADDLQALVHEAGRHVRAQAIILPVFIDDKREDGIVIGNMTFTSRILRVNVENVYRIYPFIATAGREFDAWARGLQDMLQRFWADTLQAMAVRQAVEQVGRHVRSDYRIPKTAVMTPGSLQDWPIQQQRQLFDLFEGREADIGVQLNDSMVMNPSHSVSGICFPTERDFASCQLCPREDCPGRRASYDATLYDKMVGEIPH